MIVVVDVLLLLGSVLAVVGQRDPLRRHARLVALALIALLVLALAVAWFGPNGSAYHSELGVLAILAGVFGVAGGGPVVTQVFAHIDRHDRHDQGLDESGDVLRGGAWIGGLERLAIVATLVAGWAPGLAVVLAVKALGRYPELRTGEHPGVAERFIIGTFTSVLWAVACAGLVTITRRGG